MLINIQNSFNKKQICDTIISVSKSRNCEHGGRITVHKNYPKPQQESDFIGPKQKPIDSRLLKENLKYWLETSLLPVMKQIAENK